MPDPNPAAMEFLLNRRSRPAKTLTTPVPDRAALMPILTAAARSPDHGKLEPWRFMVLERNALLRLAALIDECGDRLGKPPEDTKLRLKPKAVPDAQSTFLKRYAQINKQIETAT